ncbi:alpha/beta fold hydrolase [Lentzea tibetensis]|uniref:Alpha/beta fold hydrolase n=1 Tax=Lentzea tibetensis TaxID=2591470 RepID=A0A563EQR7_9PSEU|nr:epoxide hydrolase family protein [Lentzea tibetensis]TWP49578.1 alpha/beta fold hydrolase [Lentzea tibetensis]
MENFSIDIPQADLDDLRTRLTHTRWPRELPGNGWTRGVALTELRELVEYWATEYDWRAAEASLNKFPQHVVDFQGQPIHFVHVRSAREAALPLLLIHGWPSTFAEFADVIEPLSRDFHVVVPTIPGFGFSGPVTENGWEVARTAEAFAHVMEQLGYTRYGIQAGDVGAGIAGAISRLGDAVVAMHVNGPGPHPFGGPVSLDGLTGKDVARAERFNAFVASGLGYLQVQATRPKTVGYALNDSPVGQLAWIAEKYREWSDPNSPHAFGIDRDALLTIASIYWFTQAGASSAEYVYESMNAPGTWAAAAAPTGFAVFAADPGIRSIVDPNNEIEHWVEYDAGGHFPAIEVPDLLVEDVRTYFSTRS